MLLLGVLLPVAFSASNAASVDTIGVRFHQSETPPPYLLQFFASFTLNEKE